MQNACVSIKEGEKTLPAVAVSVKQEETQATAPPHQISMTLIACAPVSVNLHKKEEVKSKITRKLLVHAD